MTTSVETLRGTIKTIVAGVQGMGKVHDYERYADERNELKALYATSAQSAMGENPRLYGWHIRHVRTIERLVSAGAGHNVRDDYWRLRGFMSIDDAAGSEKLFDIQIEAVRAAFRASTAFRDLGDVDTHFKDLNLAQGGAPNLDESEPVLFCGVLCHGARLSFITRTYLSP